jgi:hypothetical protein
MFTGGGLYRWLKRAKHSERVGVKLLDMAAPGGDDDVGITACIVNASVAVVE